MNSIDDLLDLPPVDRVARAWSLVGATTKTSGGTITALATYVYDALNRRIETDETISGVETKTFTVAKP